MAEEKLQYQVTFRTRAEGDGAQKTTEAVKDLREEKEKLAETEAVAAAAAAEPAAEVEAVTEAINEQVESVEILQQRDADVDEARRLASERRVEEMEEQMQAEAELEQAARDSAAARVAAAAAVGLVARRSLQLISETIAEFRSIAPEAADAFSSVELAIETLTDPIGTLIEGLTGTRTALENLANSQREAARQEQLYLATLKAKQDEIRAANQAWVDGPMKRQLQAIDEQTAAYERQQREVRAVTAALEAQARLNDAIALSNGADPNEVAANRAARDAAGKTAENDTLVADAEQRWNAAIAKVETAQSAYAQAISLNLDTEAKEAELDAAIQARDQAKLELDSVWIQAEALNAEVAAAHAQTLVGVRDATVGSLEDAARETLAGLDAQAEELGSKFSRSAAESRKLLAAVLEDSVIDPSEIEEVKLAIEQLKGSREQHDRAIQDGMREMIQNVTTLLATQEQLNAQIRDQKQAIESLKNRR
jgi:hypothetical protein